MRTACWRVPVKITYYGSGHTITWFPIVDAADAEEARDKAGTVYNDRERGDIAVGFPHKLHDAEHHDDGDWGEDESANAG